MRRALFGLLICVPLLLHAQSGEWGSRGISHRFVVLGQRVFDADGRGVTLYDVSQAPVRQLFFAATGAESVDLALVTDHDLAVATRGGIQRFLVASDGTLIGTSIYPTAIATVLASNGRFLAGATTGGVIVWQPDMSTVAQFTTSQPAAALAWHGDTLVAAVPGVAIYLFDISGARDPIVIPERAYDLEVVGDTLYVAAGVDGIVEYDVSNEATPRILSRVMVGGNNFTRIAVGDGRVVAAEVPDAIDVFETSSGVPVFSTRFSEPVQTIAASGKQLFAAGTIIDRFGLPIETGAPLRVFDLSDPISPRLTSEYRDLAGPLSGVATDGSLAYVVDRPYFRVIDVSTASSPRELSSLMIDNIGDRVKVHGNLAMLFGRGQIQLIDIGNPYSPRLVKTWDAQGGPPSNAAFVRDMFIEANPYSGFHVVDFTSFATPGQIGGIKGHYYEAISDGSDVVYVSQEGVALVTIDVSDAHNPHALNSTVVAPVRGEIASPTASHPELLVLQTKTGIRIYSLADPRNPAQTSFTAEATINEIAADGDSAYSATAGSVQKIDLRDPAHPAFSTTSMQPFSPMQMAAANGKVVIADLYSLRIYGPNTAPPPPPPPPRRRAARKAGS